jgi:hypothetical protein
MSEFSFADAVLPARAVVLRLPLRPYSVGHEILLQHERNALLLTEAEFDQLSFADREVAIKQAALICSRTWAENQRGSRGVKLWGWLVRNSNWTKQAKYFYEYRHQGSTFPPAPDKRIDEIYNNVGGRMLGGELLPGLINFLLGKPLLPRVTGPRSDRGSVFDFPFGLGLQLYFTQLEVEGRRHIENEEERAHKEERYAHIADIRREQAEAALKHPPSPRPSPPGEGATTSIKGKEGICRT